MKIKNREFVLPGDKIIESFDFLPGKNCYREGKGIYSKKVGLLYEKNRVINVVPLSGGYSPEVGDMVIGEVTDVQHSGWVVDIGSSYSAFLPLAGVRKFVDPFKMDMTTIYNIGDFLYAKIMQVSFLRSVYLTMKEPGTRKLTGGRIIKISPVKVPRVIGKHGSMINIIKEKTGCRLLVGQNGIIWIDGEKSDMVVRAIRTIEEKSHVQGLTELISKMLEK